MATEAQSEFGQPGLDLSRLNNAGPRRAMGLRLSVIARMLRSRFDRKAATIGITRSQWSMIAVVAHYPGATQRSIADHLEISEASAGRLIDRLCDEGLIERRERRGDRRARAVYLTEKAAALELQLSALATESEKQLFTGFSEEEIEQLLEYMNRLYRNACRG